MAKQIKRVFLISGLLAVAAGFVLLPSIAANAQSKGAPSGAPTGGVPAGAATQGAATGARSGGAQNGAPNGAPTTATAPAGASAGAPAGAANGGRQAKAATGAAAVKVAAAVKGDMQAYIEVNGNVVNKSQVAVAPDTGGRVSDIKVQLGDTVRKGELLARIDPSKPGSVYELSPVYAPVSGVVVSAPVTAGSNIAAGGTLLTIAAGNSVEIEALIPERYAGVLAVGLKAEAGLEAYPSETFAATVKKLSPVLDAASRTKKIVLEFDAADPRINAGMFARLKLNTTRYPGVIMIPASAVVEKQGKSGVYVMAAGETVSFREVTQGVSIDNTIEITAGLNTGENVVVQGQQYLSDGAKVKVIT